MPMRAVMKGATVSIAVSSGSTPAVAADDLDATAFAALTWVVIAQVGSIGEYGPNSNIISYDELTTAVVQKQKGITNAGDPVLEVSRSTTDTGQAALRNAALTNDYHAFRVTFDDKQTSGGTNTIDYLRGLVSGPVKPNGRNEDFLLENFTLGLVQVLTVNGTN